MLRFITEIMRFGTDVIAGITSDFKMDITNRKKKGKTVLVTERFKTKPVWKVYLWSTGK